MFWQWHAHSRFLRQVVDKTAKTIADWQLIGFAHGVMNTDNLSITGATIDFGPYGFMERFNPIWSTTILITTGVMFYQNQPSIGLWNLSRLITLFLRLNGEKTDRQSSARNLCQSEQLTDILNSFGEIFISIISKVFAKIWFSHQWRNCDFALQYLEIMQQNKLDFTNSLQSASSNRCWRQTNDKLNPLHEFNLLNQLKISISSGNGQPNATLADWIATYHTKLQYDSLQLVMTQ